MLHVANFLLGIDMTDLLLLVQVQTVLILCGVTLYAPVNIISGRYFRAVWSTYAYLNINKSQVFMLLLNVAPF
jgi:hypothetical protein